MRTELVSRKSGWMALVIALLFHALLLSVQPGNRSQTGVLRGWILALMAPAEKVVDIGIEGVEGVWNGYFALVGTHRENLRLHEENANLRMELTRQQESVLEAERLRQLLDFQDPTLGRTVVARVIGADPTHSRQTITIDKGQASGVRPDNSVMTADGVVGRVIYAGQSYSIVQLLLDVQSAVGVTVRSSRVQGIVKGDGSQTLTLDFIEDDNEIKAGDELVTSGQEMIHPKGLPVGTVTAVGPRRGLFKSVTIRPNADFNRLEEVLCVVERPSEVSEPVEFPALPPIPK